VRFVTAYSPAKLNLFLEVLGKSPDGYHRIQTVLHTVNLLDRLEFFPGGNSITISCNNPEVPLDRHNTIMQAALYLQEETGKRFGIWINLIKRIPIQAGLGGGSSNAATTIQTLNRIFKLRLPFRRLLKIAARIGSDVPFFLYKGTALCSGRGEEIRRVSVKRRYHFVLLCPPLRCSTTDVYKRYDIINPNLTYLACDVKLLLRTLVKGGISRLRGLFFNRLYEAAVSLEGSLTKIYEEVRRSGFLDVCMTGSGSAFYGLCSSGKEAMQKAQILSRRGLGRVFLLASY
jgi:4-diphosphocytidyl-2-C-methyl-D-erythritol kinase